MLPICRQLELSTDTNSQPKGRDWVVGLALVMELDAMVKFLVSQWCPESWILSYARVQVLSHQRETDF
jgi:hypothetical protein